MRSLWFFLSCNHDGATAGAGDTTVIRRIDTLKLHRSRRTRSCGGVGEGAHGELEKLLNDENSSAERPVEAFLNALTITEMIRWWSMFEKATYSAGSGSARVTVLTLAVPARPHRRALAITVNVEQNQDIFRHSDTKIDPGPDRQSLACSACW